ncbi:peptide ABC transporter substrate-binding protein [Bifidobacterium simiiventris]|uniref:peptide ABC transporter substrate-binding protein n=1 Tax=Bifidobacterium simiiventris TaxID=2834434 RepID=UPI001C58E860|nr:ABC transporter substrate-binding protein [Bifidobacterium simiiventris]MBW3077618.1 ABC transporter substrate-binding protein [Bifidobacterium simiiventris]
MAIRSSRAFTAVAAALSAGLLLAGCGSTSAGNGGSDTASSDNIITIASGEPQKGLIPGDTYEAAGGNVIDMAFSGLVVFKADGTAVNEVADKITPNSDSTKFDITLKSGWKFSDGTPVTSESFTKAWSYTANAKNGQLCASFFSMIKGYDDLQDTSKLKGDEQLSGLHVIDDTHFTVELNKPYSVFPVILGYSGYNPLPEAFYKDPKAFGEKPISDGPYIVKKWEHNSSIEMVKNPDYKGNLTPKNDGLTFKIYTSNNASYSDVQSGNLDVSATIPSSAVKTFQKEPKLGSYSEPGSGIATFTIPDTLEHFKNDEEGKLRRQAISMAINRKTLCDKIMAGTATPASDFTAPPVSGYSDSLKNKGTLEYNPTKAKELWAKADKISKFTGTFTIAYNSDGDYKATYDAVINQIKNVLGIDAATNPMPTSNEFHEAVTSRSIKGAFRAGWQADYPSIENYLAPLYASNAADGHGSNDGDYKNPEFDALLDKAASASSVDAANKLYQQSEEILLNDLPSIPLYNQNSSAVYAKGVKNAEPTWKGVPTFYELTKK